LGHLKPGQVLGRVVEEAGLGVEEELVIFSASSKTNESVSLGVHISKKTLITAIASSGMLYG
jgi:hypothetical protein